MTNVVSIRKRTTKVCQKCRVRKPVDQFELLPVPKRTAKSYARCIPCREIIATNPPHAASENTWIKEDGILDDIAVDRACNGGGGGEPPALTLAEARKAAGIMRRRGLPDLVIAERLGITDGCVRIWVAEGRLPEDVIPLERKRLEKRDTDLRYGVAA